MKSTTSRGGAVDAVVIGAGHNGLVAAALLADAGWDVLVLEAQAEPGGAVKSAELTPGYLSDLYSAFYPLSVTSPALEELHLEDHGLRWTHAPAVVGHARSATDEDAPLIYRDIDHTAADWTGIIPATAVVGVHCSISGSASKVLCCQHCSPLFRLSADPPDCCARWVPPERSNSPI